MNGALSANNGLLYVAGNLTARGGTSGAGGVFIALDKVNTWRWPRRWRPADARTRRWITLTLAWSDDNQAFGVLHGHPDRSHACGDAAVPRDPPLCSPLNSEN